jgi:hypothetical protein
MGIKQYWTKTKGFFKDLFGYKDKKILEYEKELVNLYNNLMSGMERLYYGFSGERLNFAPITSTSFRTNYDDLFSDSVRRDFNIYQINKGMMLRRKNLEEYL